MTPAADARFLIERFDSLHVRGFSFFLDRGSGSLKLLGCRVIVPMYETIGWVSCDCMLGAVAMALHEALAHQLLAKDYLL